MFKLILFSVCFVRFSSGDLNNVNVYVRNYVGEKNYRSFFNENMNNLKEFVSLEVFNSTIKILEEGDIQDFPNVKELSLNAVDLGVLKPTCLKDLPNLKYLYFERNKLKKIPEGVLNNLQIRTLSFRENQIEHIETHALDDMPYLFKLDLSMNMVTAINPEWFANSKALVELSLSSNKLTEIPHGAFQNVKDLRNIDLSQNRIKVLEEHFFADLKQLKLLNLSVNKIHTIQNGTFKIHTNLKVLQLFYNKLQCLSDEVLNSLNHDVSVFLVMNTITQDCKKKLQQFKKGHSRILLYY